MKPMHIKLLCVAVAAALFVASGGDVDFETLLSVLSDVAASIAGP